MRSSRYETSRRRRESEREAEQSRGGHGWGPLSEAHRVALITGASSGIGAATARELGRRGYRLALAARRRDMLEDVAREVRTHGGQAIPLACDMANAEQIVTTVERTLAEFRRIDVLVNNAGVMHLGKIDGGNVEEWRQMIDVNLIGLILMTRAVLPHMKRQRDGHIVNMSSVAGRIIRAGSGIYNVTKWGVNVFSEALRQEVYADKIRVTIVEPGFVQTELIDRIGDPEAQSTFRAWGESMTALTSADIANAVAYALEQPAHVNVNEITIRPTDQDR